jgi:hypothetical protein
LSSVLPSMVREKKLISDKIIDCHRFYYDLVPLPCLTGLARIIVTKNRHWHNSSWNSHGS